MLTEFSPIDKRKKIRNSEVIKKLAWMCPLQNKKKCPRTNINKNKGEKL